MRDIFSFHLMEIIPLWFIFLLFGCTENIHATFFQLFFYALSSAIKMRCFLMLKLKLLHAFTLKSFHSLGVLSHFEFMQLIL